MLVVHHVLSIVPETRGYKISGLQEENILERYYARITNESQSAGTKLATAIDRKIIRKHITNQVRHGGRT